jgi:hypothetical protein
MFFLNYFFALIGQVSSLFDQNTIYLEATATANQMMCFSGLAQQRCKD